LKGFEIRGEEKMNSGLRIFSLSFVFLGGLCFNAFADSGSSLGDIEKEIAGLESEVQKLENTYLKGEEVDIKGSNVEKKVADGELYFRLGDYQRSAVVFLDIVERFKNHPAYPNALFMLAESMFMSKDYFGARSRYIELLDQQGQLGFSPYITPSLSRLLEISMHLQEFEGAEKYFNQLDAMSGGKIEATTQYVRGKYFYFKNDLDRALAIFQSIKEKEQYYPEAQFFTGVIYTQKKDFNTAIGIFKQLASMNAQTPKERKIVNLAKLNAGRLYYETDQLERAAELYESIPPTSDIYDQALYESSLVYIKMGDPTKSERSLEVLSISNPESVLIPQAKILRGNLLLRVGKFDEAEALFKEIGKQFQPVKDELDQIIAKHPDPEEYFHELVKTNLETFDAGSFLPPLAMNWMKTDSAMERAMQVLGEVSLCKNITEDNMELVEKIKFVLEGPGRVNAFPKLKAGKARANQIENRLTQLMKRMIEYQMGITGKSANMALDDKKLENLDEMVEKLPTTPEEFAAREKATKENINGLAQALAILEARVDRLHAKIVATKLYIDGSIKAKSGVVPPDISAVEGELKVQQNGIENFKKNIDEVFKLISLARSSIGVGDENDRMDAGVRNEYKNLIKKQLQMMKDSGVDSGTISKIEGLVGRISGIVEKLASFNARVETMAIQKSQEILRQVEDEIREIDSQKADLDSISAESEQVVGGITMLNFTGVKNKFDDLIVKSDVGIIDVAWARKEEHRNRVQYLTSDRLQQLQFLDDEFNEIFEEEEKEEKGGKNSEE